MIRQSGAGRLKRKRGWQGFEPSLHVTREVHRTVPYCALPSRAFPSMFAMDQHPGQELLSGCDLRSMMLNPHFHCASWVRAVRALKTALGPLCDEKLPSLSCCPSLTPSQ